MTEQGQVSIEEFRLMADRAGLGLSDQSLAELKPVYDLYAAQLHTINFSA